MEYCGGPTLDKFMSKRNLNEAGVRRLFSQFGMSLFLILITLFDFKFPQIYHNIKILTTFTAAGLKYMWTKNIIHRYLISE